MTAIKTSNLGFPRIGANREWKKTLEAFWKNEKDEKTFLQEMNAQFQSNILKQKEVDLIPVSDFSFYDHVLDTAVMFNWIPKRFRHITEPLNLYFAMARGTDKAVSCEMTKWFNTNYHYIVPEYEADTVYKLTENKPLAAFRKAKKEFGIETKPVIVGIYSFVTLAKGYSDEEKEEIYHKLLPLYIQLLKELEAEGAAWVQIDEPALAAADNAEVLAVKALYEQIKSELTSVKVLLQTYFDSVDEYEELITYPVDGIGLDFVHDKGRNLNSLKTHGFPADKVLAAGILDGRGIWKADIEERFEFIQSAVEELDITELWIQPSSSLLHLPVEKHPDEHLDAELLNGLSFATDKLNELKTLKKGLVSGKASIQEEIKQSQNDLNILKLYAETGNHQQDSQQERFHRELPFEERLALQQKSLKLPLLPTTTIGSFPQTTEVRKARQKWRKNEWSDQEYDHFIKSEIKKWIDIQEEIGLDVLVHGEFERTDMVEFFGEKLSGFAFTKYAWVQSYGSRCVRPPIIYGDVAFKEEMTVKETVYAQSLTSKKVKGMLTGPVTILNWSFPRYDLPKKEIAFQIARALKKEVEALEQAGISIIQVDEPALREGLPIKEDDWDEYLTWAAESFRLSTSSVEPTTQIHTHMCYSHFEDIVDTIHDLDADVITIEHSRSHGELVKYLKNEPYKKGLGLGVYDIHSPRVPSVQEMLDIIDDALTVCPTDRFWINPDCGLKTRQQKETVASLKNMVDAAKQARNKASVQV